MQVFCIEYGKPRDLKISRSLCPPAACAGHHSRGDGCLKETSWQDLWIMEKGAQASGFWAGLMTPLKGCTGAPSSWRTEACGRDTLEQGEKNCSSVGRTHTGEFHGGLSPLWRIPCWRKGKKEKLAAEKSYMMNWLYSQLSALLGGGEKIRDEAKLRKEEDMGGRWC